MCVCVCVLKCSEPPFSPLHQVRTSQRFCIRSFQAPHTPSFVHDISIMYMCRKENKINRHTHLCPSLHLHLSTQSTQRPSLPQSSWGGLSLYSCAPSLRVPSLPYAPPTTVIIAFLPGHHDQDRRDEARAAATQRDNEEISEHSRCWPNAEDGLMMIRWLRIVS